MNVVVTGSLGYDYIMDFSGKFADRIRPENIHKISLSFLADKLNKQFGGTAGNIAYTLKLLGTSPLIQSCAGNDFLLYKKFLQKKSLSTKYIPIIKDVLCGTYFVVTDREDNQIGTFYKGALAHNGSLSLTLIDASYDFVVLAPNETKAMKQYVRECIRLKKPYLYDPAFQISEFTKDELRMGITHASVVIGNDYEMDLMREKIGVTKKQFSLLAPIMITTLGKKGSLIETKNETISIKPAKIKNDSDPTGAGDAYRGGFLAGYLRKFDLKTCGQMGSVAAAYTVETYGTVTHTYTKKQYCERYRKNYGVLLHL